MSFYSDWQRLASFSAGYEADLAEAVLRAHEIPVLRKGPEVGIFGPGFAGPTARGVEILVPADRVEEAQALLASESA
jgi:hypothetical protein